MGTENMTPPQDAIARTGAIAIGRNEGQRLVRCLESIAGSAGYLVYVDSGSTDDSVAAARAIGAEVVELDMSVSFTAARARNAGFEALMLRADDAIDYVQFVDGDCELQPDWIDTARQFLDNTPSAAVACGRRRELFPEASVYNRLCDWEWDTPIGKAKACGGDALMRVSAFRQVGGFDASLIAGEEPELCVRLRQCKWQIWRLDAEMTLHDAAMTRFSQWWKRGRRGGHAYAEGQAMHGAPPEQHGTAETRRALIWGALLPIMILGLTFLTGPWALLLLLIYPLQVLRLAARENPKGRDVWERAFFMTLIKFPEALGALEFRIRRLLHKPRGLVEYK